MNGSRNDVTGPDGVREELSAAPVHGHDIIVIGASSGGVDALIRVVRRLPPDLPAAVFVVLHMGPGRTSALPAILGREGRLPVVEAADGDLIRSGRIYVAPPDRHLIVRPGRVALSTGPRENRVRPSIDVLFRTAAVAYPGRVIAAVLTGGLDDGANGMVAVKQCGGITIVQDPSEAPTPSMPRAALEAAPIDHICLIDELGVLLGGLARQPAPPASAPPDLALEATAAVGADPPVRSPSGESAEPPYALACPDCGGALRETDDRRHHYRCQVGHAFNLESLLAAYGDELERSLWAAVRTMEERVAILDLMAGHQDERHHRMTARGYRERAQEMRGYAARLRALLVVGAALAAPPPDQPSHTPGD